MRIVSEGWIFILGIPAVCAALAAGAIAMAWTWVAVAFAILGGIGLSFMVWFFRDPEREAPEGEGLIVSGADGRVRRVERLEKVEGFDGAVTRISVYLTPWDVHVNRTPCHGEVDHLDYVPGRHILTAKDEASEVNEHSVIRIQGDVTCVVHQIVGPLVRRVVYWFKVGQKVGRGERLGLMKFGSRLDVYLPADAVEVSVSPGEKVYAGLTVMAQVKQLEKGTES